ncbi:2-hydroxychromene-2-carboxylate isomerase [Streptosporangium pseudovulgare]|uniref:DSBA-like thioredoxin domain-containing protein n=1 Tax=Streptosporangium pseudovulgare TaxID=35765 RepID=A0ABQ2R0L9_9ACTN|nr:DsbA family protein [Streptosporangium pseudovulgare]GGQ06531.1 hypothetical protein GCM10010140_40860 [Streptosporangium pseudovulgare]
MKRVVGYFSLRSPYSWLARHDLFSRYPDVADAMEWRPFWEPSEAYEARLREAGGRFPYTPMSKEKHLYVLQDVRRLATARGLTVAWPVDRNPVWEVAHLPYFAAAEAGLGRRYVEAVQRARWQGGRNVCDPEVIAEIGAELGVDTTAPAEEAAVAALLDVYRDGVFGVPFFIHGREKFWGVDRLAAFAASVRAERADRSDLADRTDRADRVSGADQVDRTDRADRASGADRADGPDEAAESWPDVSAEVRGSDLGHAGGCG